MPQEELQHGNDASGVDSGSSGGRLPSVAAIRNAVDTPPEELSPQGKAAVAVTLAVGFVIWFVTFTVLSFFYQDKITGAVTILSPIIIVAWQEFRKWRERTMRDDDG